MDSPLVFPQDTPPALTLDALALAINADHDAVEQMARSTLDRARAAGDKLLAAKAQVEHGQWLSWLAEHCPRMSERTGRAYMRLARNWETLESKTAVTADLSLDGALKLLAAPEEPETDPEKDALRADLETFKARSEEWKAQALTEKKQRRALEERDKARLQELRDAEAVHLEHLAEMRIQLAEEERKRPRTDAELAAQQAALSALQTKAYTAQTALNLAKKEKADLDKAIQDQRKDVALRDKILDDWTTAALAYRQVALKLAGATPALHKIPMTDPLYEQVEMLQEVSADVSRALSNALAVCVVAA